MTTAPPVNRRLCSEPLEWERLVDYWTGELAESDEEAVERHVMGCAWCAARLSGLAAVTGAVREWLRGGIEPVVTWRAIEALRREGASLTEVRLAPGERRGMTIPREADFVVARLAADLVGVRRVDVELCGEDGEPLFTVRDAAFDGESGEVLVLCERHLAASHKAIVFRVSATEGGGTTRTAEYAVLTL